MPKSALLYDTVKQHEQNFLSLIAIITNISLFRMKISIHPDRRRFELVISLYLNLIGYIFKKIQVSSYQAITEICCYGGCQGGAVSLMYIVTKLNERDELDVMTSVQNYVITA